MSQSPKLIEARCVSAVILFASAQVILFRIARRSTGKQAFVFCAPATDVLIVLSALAFPVACFVFLESFVISGRLLGIAGLLVAEGFVGVLVGVVTNAYSN